MHYTPAFKGGRVRTATDKRGTDVHAILGNEENGFWGIPALCNAKPGKNGYGWCKSEWNPIVSCSKCLEKLKCNKNEN